MGVLPGDQNIIHETIYGFPMSFVTVEGLFSPKAIDAGTLAMLSCCELSKGQKVHDLGCGYGVVGVACAKIAGAEFVYMSDVDSQAVLIAKENALRNDVPQVSVICSDGYRDFEESGFDVILCNPPYHSDFSVAKHFIEKGFNRLKIDGRMFMVVKRLEWYKRKFIAVFGGVKVHRTGGYFVLEACKREWRYAGKSRREGI